MKNLLGVLLVFAENIIAFVIVGLVYLWIAYQLWKLWANRTPSGCVQYEMRFPRSDYTPRGIEIAKATKDTGPCYGKDDDLFWLDLVKDGNIDGKTLIG